MNNNNPTLAARKLPLATLTPTSCQRLLPPWRRMLHMEGPGESIASIIIRILPAASIAASREAESVILYWPTYLGSLPARRIYQVNCYPKHSDQLENTILRNIYKNLAMTKSGKKKGSNYLSQPKACQSAHGSQEREQI